MNTPLTLSQASDVLRDTLTYPFRVAAIKLLAFITQRRVAKQHREAWSILHAAEMKRFRSILEWSATTDTEWLARSYACVDSSNRLASMEAAMVHGDDPLMWKLTNG